MTSNLDSPDFTNLSTRAMLSLVNSPIVSAASGQHSQVLAVDSWARSINVLVVNARKVLSLSITGSVTGFTYLNACPVYDGGLYYIPIVSAVDTSITVAWYQVDATSVSIYTIESDEPISVTLFNPITPTQAISERLTPNSPLSCGPVGTSSLAVQLDVTTNALRCTVDLPANVSYGQVHGDQSGIFYYDGSAASQSFPTTPIPIDRTLDTSVTVTVLTVAGKVCNMYVAAVNSPDFSAGIPLTVPMSANELAPDPRQSETPNQPPVRFNGTIAASGNQQLIAPLAGRQLRLHQLAVFFGGNSAAVIELQDTSGLQFFQIRTAFSTQLLVPLFGQLATVGAGIKLQNLAATLSGVISVTLWYSVL